MRKRTLGAVLLAGLAVSGTGAFTASNDVSAINGGTNNVAGYGQAVVTGATVTGVHYNTATADASKLASVVFTATEDVTGKTSVLQLRSGATGGTINASYTCSSTYTPPVLTVTPGYSTITCATSPNPDLTSFTSVGLSVTQ